MWYRFGKSGSLRVEAQAELTREGRFAVYCSAPDYGQGTNTVMTQIAAEFLGVSRDCIDLINADTALAPDSGIQGASRATYWVGAAVKRAAETLRLGILGVASELVGCDPGDLRFEGERVVSRRDPGRGLALSEVAAEFDRMGRPRRIPGVFDLTPLFPDGDRPDYSPQFTSGAHAAEVLVDAETGLVEVTRMVAVHDVGHAVNPLDTRGQIEGATIMGLGSALLEEYTPGATTGFVNYILPMIGAIPEIEVILVEVPSHHGPLGAKGIGEVAMLPSTPAIINALSRALGVRVRDIPATPERVLRALGRLG
jgi:CO/xanthine dehydrogenase Mo-binding subunit